MRYGDPSFYVNVDISNPGQFFACCGLLELAHRLWPGVEGWFDISTSRFFILSVNPSATLQALSMELSRCEISGLTDKEHRERESLENKARQFKKQHRKLPEDMERRRTELGTMAREGSVILGEPFNLTLDWWRTDHVDLPSPKTWAGRQEVHKVARAAQDSLSKVQEPERLLEYSCVIYMPSEYQKNNRDYNKTVEPFYFDARRFANALDTGFSLDVQDAETIAYPAVELLSLIGLQRFRPASSSKKWVFEYMVWSKPLSAIVAPAIVCCAVSSEDHYRFQLQFRDNQKRYKAFSLATPTGGQKWAMSKDRSSLTTG